VGEGQSDIERWPRLVPAWAKTRPGFVDKPGLVGFQEADHPVYVIKILMLGDFVDMLTATTPITGLYQSELVGLHVGIKGESSSLYNLVYFGQTPRKGYHPVSRARRFGG
jgi:hypothetical protein